MNICEATPTDLKTVMAWIMDAEMCRAWAGPMVRFPLNPEGLVQDIEVEPDNSYCLRDNLAALRLYTRTGFSEDVENATPELCYMIAHGKLEG